MRLARNTAGICVFIFFSASGMAQTLPLQNVDADAMNKVVGDMSANFLHTSVSGAGTLGHVFGFEIGLVGGETQTPHLNDVANSQPGVSANAGKLPDGELLGAVSFPLGITGEIGYVPKVGGNNFQFNSLSLAAKWTVTELFLSDLPFSLAAKLEHTASTVSFNQTISSVPTDFSFTDSETALLGLISKNFAIVEPYAGLGWVTANGTLSANGSGTVFNQNFTTGNSASATRAGGMFLVGAELKLIVFKLGLEYSNLLNTSRINGKLSFYF